MPADPSNPLEVAGEWMLGYLQSTLPSDYWQFLIRYVISPDTPVQHVRRRLVSRTRQTAAALCAMAEPALNRALAALYSSPDIVVLVFVLVVLALAFQILNFARRVMLFWTRLLLRAVLWAVFIAFLALIWQRGVGRSLSEGVALVNKLAGYAAIAKDVWLREYQNWEAQAAAHNREHGGNAYPGGYRGNR